MEADAMNHDELNALIERLREPLSREETMQCWDHWRRLMKQTQSSLPRDAFEAWCETQDEEERTPAADAIAALMEANTRAAEPMPDGGLVERLAVNGVSDKMILRLDVDEDDPVLSRIIDELREDLSAALSLVRAADRADIVALVRRVTGEDEVIGVVTGKLLVQLIEREGHRHAT